jgi:hypothetical protein
MSILTDCTALHHQLGIDRGAAGVAVKRRQLAAEIPEIEDDVNLPEEVVAGTRSSRQNS